MCRGILCLMTHWMRILLLTVKSNALVKTSQYEGELAHVGMVPVSPAKAGIVVPAVEVW